MCMHVHTHACGCYSGRACVSIKRNKHDWDDPTKTETRKLLHNFSNSVFKSLTIFLCKTSTLEGQSSSHTNVHACRVSMYSQAPRYQVQTTRLEKTKTEAHKLRKKKKQVEHIDTFSATLVESRNRTASPDTNYALVLSHEGRDLETHSQVSLLPPYTCRVAYLWI